MRWLVLLLFLMGCSPKVSDIPVFGTITKIEVIQLGGWSGGVGYSLTMSNGRKVVSNSPKYHIGDTIKVQEYHGKTYIYTTNGEMEVTY